MRYLTILLLVLVSSSVVSAATAPSADTAAKALSSSPRHGEWADIALPGSETKIHTWVVYPERKEKAPVVVVIHEIFGMTDWVRSVADALAAEGFIAVAPDLLSGKGPNGGGTESFEADKVRDAIRTLTVDDYVARLNAVRDHATAFPSANGKSATIGFCWGGAASFAYATKQPKLNAAIVYYGSPPKEGLDKIEAPVAGFYGGDDARITSTVEATEKSMKEAKKQYTHHVFEGAGHGFLRQQSGKDGANQKAADQAWTETVAFLKKSME